MEELTPTTKNILSILESTPVIVLRRDPSGRGSSERVLQELRDLAGEKFRTFEGPEGIAIITEGAARQFLI